MFGMSEKHPNEGNMDRDEEGMQSITPGAEGTVTSGQERAIIMEKRCGKPVVSIDVAREKKDEILAFAG